MAGSSAQPSPADLVGGVYAVDHAAPYPNVAGAFGARHVRDGSGALATRVQRDLPARGKALAALAGAAVPNLLLPLAHGPAPAPGGETGYYIVTKLPPGPALAAELAPWSEQAMVDWVLRPAAACLLALQTLRTPHRAIRLDNLFHAGHGQPVTLGPAWAAPPACHQPALFEPPYVACCLPAGRGDGSVADDVYALGVLLVLLALGRDPLAGLEAEAVIHAKLDVGSYAALVGTARLPAGLGELVRGMLADDPEHRPSPQLLCDPAAARARRLATRSARRAPRPVQVGGVEAWNARTLAFGVLRHPDQALALLRSGAVDVWLRRGIGDAALTSQVDELVRARPAAAKPDAKADASLLAAVAAVLDPLAPLVWSGRALWPDGLGAALRHALSGRPADVRAIASLLEADAFVDWAMRRPGRSDPGSARLDARQHRQWLAMPQPGAGLLRLCYTLNPLAPCDSPLLLQDWLVHLADMLPLLERRAGQDEPAGSPLDLHGLAFLAARRDEQVDAGLARLAQAPDATEPLGQLALLARLQDRLPTVKLPQLASWAGRMVLPVLERFSSANRRARLAAEIAGLVDKGRFTPLLTLLRDQQEETEDRAGRQAAQERLAAIGVALASLDGDPGVRNAAARRVGRDVGTGVGLLALAASLVVAALA